LLKLGIAIAKRTVQKYMRQARHGEPSRRSGQTWGTFLANHGDQMWACDFLQTYDLWFKAVFIFVIVELSSRRIVHIGVTRHPTDDWTAQQLREATPFDEGPRFLILDNDTKYGTHFAQVAAGSQIKLLRTPLQTPTANAICERCLGSVRRECLDHVVIFGEAHLQHLMTLYVAYFNRARPHQGIGQRIPEAVSADFGLLLVDQKRSSNRSVVAIPVLGGLHHDYRRAA
jgi:putative transposase